MRLIGTGVAIRRDQLLYLLSHCVQRARVDQVLQELRRSRFLRTVYTAGKGEAVYLLTKRGLRQVGEDTTEKSVTARLTYHLAVSDVLCHCVKQIGVDGWEWFSRPKCPTGKRQIPSAMVKVNDSTWYLDIDDGMRLSRQLSDTCHFYTRLLCESGQSRVLFVAGSERREMYLRSRVTRFCSDEVRFDVCNVDQVAEYLRDTEVAIG